MNLRVLALAPPEESKSRSKGKGNARFMSREQVKKERVALMNLTRTADQIGPMARKPEACRPLAGG